MAYIFLDESGDLGFNFKKKKTSKYFVVTFLFVREKVLLEKIVKEIFKGFSKTEIKNHDGVLHAFKETRRQDKNYSICLEKKKCLMFLLFI